MSAEVCYCRRDIVWLEAAYLLRAIGMICLVSGTRSRLVDGFVHWAEWGSDWAAVKCWMCAALLDADGGCRF